MKRFPIVLAASFCCLLVIVTEGTSYCQKLDASPRKTVLFAVWPAEKGKEPDAPLLDPIVLLTGKRLERPPEEKDSDAVWDRFQKVYYQAGQKYPMLIHGSAEGAVTIREATSISCVSLMATVSLSQPLPEDHMRIAASSLVGLGVHSDRDQEITTVDRSAFLGVALAYLKEKGINLPVSRIRLESLYSVSLSADTSNALVGSVSLQTKAAIHHLFVLAAKKNQGYVVDLASYRVAKDVVDHTDDVDEDFVEHLDLDEAGTDEIITMMHYYESWNYNIYRQTNGVWKAVYNGGGGGC